MKNDKVINAPNYLSEHNIIELLKNQLVVHGLARQTRMQNGLQYMIERQTETLDAIAQGIGINIERILMEFQTELSAGVRDMDAGMEIYFRNVSKRTGMTRDEFQKLL